jgi:hypothetical protein
MKSSIYFKQDYYGGAPMTFIGRALVLNYPVQACFHCAARLS